ncbi:hypothetical protein BJV74DRAFT_794086 [Russula compacta]|nr:hypothetical protein BJV74DRAFT_794086 [Russula compacta]
MTCRRPDRTCVLQYPRQDLRAGYNCPQGRRLSEKLASLARKPANILVLVKGDRECMEDTGRPDQELCQFVIATMRDRSNSDICSPRTMSIASGGLRERSFASSVRRARVEYGVKRVECEMVATSGCVEHYRLVEKGVHLVGRETNVTNGALGCPRL